MLSRRVMAGIESWPAALRALERVAITIGAAGVAAFVLVGCPGDEPYYVDAGGGPPAGPGPSTGAGGQGGACAFSMCDGSCVDLSSDVDNCGACGRSCSPDHVQQRVCVAGSCRPSCGAG